MKMIKIVLFLSFLLNSIFLISLNDIDIIPIQFDGVSYSEYYTLPNIYFQVTLKEGAEIKDYLKVEVSNANENENPNLVIAFSNTDETCIDREQLSYGISTTQMWLTKAQIENKNMYINIICSSNDCNYELKLTGSDFITLDFNSQFNLYVTGNNKNVDILFSSESEDDNSDYTTIWAIGNKNVQTHLDIPENEYKKYSKNNIYKINKKTINLSTFPLKVIGEEGDVINIGSSTIYSDSYDKLIINQPEIKGYVEKDYNAEDCYEFHRDDAFSSSKKFSLSGIIYSKIAEIYYKDESGKKISGSESIINNGTFINNFDRETSPYYFCIRFPTKDKENYNINEIYYSLQLTNPSNSQLKIGLYSPQIYGELYPRILQENEEYGFVGITPSDLTNQISIDMISQFGFSDLYYHYCKNYPICDQNDEENPRSINGHSTYKVKYEKESPMSPKQYILYVKCLAGPCGFKTSFNSDIVNINLKEYESFSQFILKGEKDLYKVDYSGEKSIKKIYVDLIVLTGDVNFNTTDSKLEVKKLFNSNKIFYIITINELDENQEIFFSISASKNSYYSIEFRFERENDDSNLRNVIEPGFSYLVTINPEETDSQGVKTPYKYVKFTNLRMNDNNKFLVQFYSLNCLLNVTARKVDEDGKYYFEEIKAFDQYYQDLVLKNIKNDYEYRLYIKETDSSIYNNKLCMVYASALELESLKELDERQIVISDNEPKQIAFKKGEINEIEYLYPHGNSSNDVIININLLDIAEYRITVSFDHKHETVYEQTGNDLIYLSKNEWKGICKNNEICPIIIKITLHSTFVENEPKLLISVKAVQDNIPSYITKNKAKLDFLLGTNWQYYYTDLGKDEEGDVIVSYRRGSGRLFGKIVPKNLNTPEEGANWRENYKFPTTVKESLTFNGYIKKIVIRKNETNICEDGCYLLLALKTSIVSEEQQFKNDFREHPFNIIIHTRSSNQVKDLPIVKIPIREYIIGNLYTHQDNNIYEYYSTIFIHDSHKIIIDFQSKVVNFYINVGADNKPILGSEIDFVYESNGTDTIFEITKEEFLEKCKKRNISIPHEGSLLGLSMTIGLWTNKTDSFYTTVYSFKIHLPFDKVIDIYEVKSDQKTLCKTEYVNVGGGYYRCLFMVFYLGVDAVNHLLLYPLIQDHSSYYMYANFIDQDGYEFFDFSYLKTKMPNYESFYSTNRTGLDYIYIENGERSDQFLFVSVVTKTNTIIELLTSLYTKDIQLSPNPSSPQLFLLDKAKDHFLFEFTTDEDLFITIKTISGQGNIYWETDNNAQYSLHGRENFISLTNSLLDKSNETKVFSNLYVKNNNVTQLNCSGLAFYIDYLLRPSQVDLDEIQLGQSNQIAYRNTDLPVYIYAKLKDKSDTNIFVNLYELVGESYSQFTTKIPFIISCAFANDTDIMNLKIYPEYLNNLKFNLKGVYDPMIKTGFILIKKGDINLDIPNVVIQISKNKDYPKMKNFTRINLEASIIQDKSNIPVVSDIYHYGKLNLDTDINTYKLRTHKYGKYMRIHYSPNSDKIKYSITKNPGEKTNSTFNEFKAEIKNGKTIITFNSDPKVNDFIYLNIFHDSKKADTDQITNYAFKYMNSEKTNNFKTYELADKEGFRLDTKENGDKYDYTFTISPLPYTGIDVTYFIKFVAKDDWTEGEGDNCIAVRESKSYVEELSNLEMKEDKIIKKYENIDEIDYRYVQIIALVKDNGNIEFVGYQSIYIKDSIVWKIVLIIIAAIIVLIIVIYLIHIYIKKKRSSIPKIKIEGPMVSRMTEASEKNE